METKPNWNEPVAPCPSSEYSGGYNESTDGDNPSIGVSAELPVQGDLRPMATSRGNDPTPAMPGA